MSELFRQPNQYHLPAAAAAGTIAWTSPSNIAIVKYWGKFGQQLPRNPSLSFTLSAAHTTTVLHHQPRQSPGPTIALTFEFEGQPRPAFAQKLEQYLSLLQREGFFPFLSQLELHLKSANSFPHSAGIASSASSMSALALCLCNLEQELFGTLSDPELFAQKASFVARLGSGSASRSIYPILAAWGEHPAYAGSSDLYAWPCAEWTHPIFHHYHDAILMVSKKEKAVSSRAGHQLMENHPYAAARYAQAQTAMQNLRDILAQGDPHALGQILESEALTLHALMMCSEPPFILLHPNTLILIEKIRQYRSSTGHPLYFTLDAGPNLHLLYPDEIQEPVQAFIHAELLPYCEGSQYIADRVGKGPSPVSSLD